MKTVEVEVLEEGAWEPFGWVPVKDTDERDGVHRLRYEWDDVHLNVIGHSLEEVSKTSNGLRCDELFHHVTHTQALMSLNCDCVVVVASASATFESVDDLDQVRAFLLRPLECVVLHPATWHWGPYPLDDTPVSLLNVQGLRYAEDNGRTDLKELGCSLEIDLRNVSRPQPGT
jgi:ureidoglycolate hydrolase